MITSCKVEVHYQNIFSIRKKTKIDILVDDGLNVVSRTSYVFPTHLIESTPLPPIEPNEQFALNSGSYF